MKRLEKEEHCHEEQEGKSGEEKEKHSERLLLPYKEIFQQWNLQNVYSHITIKITKSFHHFCFK